MAKTYKYNKDDDNSTFDTKKEKIKNQTNNRIKRVMKSHKGQKAFLDLYDDEDDL